MSDESLLVLRGLGVQTCTSSSTYLSSSSTRFIPTAQIQDIVIHEAFKGMEVRFYLAIIVEGATEVVVVFPVRISYPFLLLPHPSLLTSRRTSCRDARSWKKSGEALENVSMIPEAGLPNETPLSLWLGADPDLLWPRGTSRSEPR